MQDGCLCRDLNGLTHGAYFQGSIRARGHIHLHLQRFADELFETSLFDLQPVPPGVHVGKCVVPILPCGGRAFFVRAQIHQYDRGVRHRSTSDIGDGSDDSSEADLRSHWHAHCQQRCNNGHGGD